MWPLIVDLILGRGLMVRLVSFSLLVLLWLMLRPEPVKPPVVNAGPLAATEEAE